MKPSVQRSAFSVVVISLLGIMLSGFSAFGMCTITSVSVVPDCPATYGDSKLDDKYDVHFKVIWTGSSDQTPAEKADFSLKATISNHVHPERDMQIIQPPPAQVDCNGGTLDFIAKDVFMEGDFSIYIIAFVMQTSGDIRISVLEG